MIYEFECARGHVTEASVPVGTKHTVCETCVQLMKSKPPLYHKGEPVCDAWNPMAHRILSPTRTTFVFADTHRKHRR